MARKYTNWTKDVLEPIVQESTSYSQCLDKMGIVKAGGNYKNLQNNIDKMSIDTSHFLGQAHNSGKEIKPFDGLTSPKSIKTRLISEIGHCCTNCKNSEWLGVPITLELEHIDGNNKDHSRSNVTLLCPNCHSQTLTWRNRKR